MKTKYNIEELKYNLPDYISKNLTDNEITGAIETELRTNREFQIELEEIKNTFGFLENAKLEDPPANYFSNLPVKINQRISEELVSVSFWGRLGLFWKILIPAVTAIIIVGIILMNRTEKDTGNIQTNIEQNKIGIPNKIEPPKIENNTVTDNREKTNEDKQSSEIVNKQIKESKTHKKAKRFETTNDFVTLPNETVKITEVKGKAGELIADNIKIIDDSNSDEVDVMISVESADEDEGVSLDEEFQSLTPAEQKVIIDNLIKAQI